MNQRILNKNLFFFIVILGFGLFQGIKAERNNFNISRSCRNYPYKNGINFRINSDNSFKILSTSNVEVLDSFVSFALDEAELTANSNLSEFLKLNDSPKEEDLIKELKIRKNGRLIRRKSQVQKEIAFFKFIFSNGFKGISLIDSCLDIGKRAMVTVEITDKTFKMAEILEKRMK